MDNFEITKYLHSLQHYLLGDIKEFEKLCIAIELEEMKNMPNFNMGSMYDPNVYDEYHRNKGISESDRFFRLTIPITLSLFSAIEILGFLISENEINQTEKNFISFFNKTYPSIDIDQVRFLNRIFRQGLSHVYFPKLGLGLKHHSTNPEKKLFFKTQSGTTFLNVNFLKEIVITGMNEIVNDQELHPSIEKRYQLLIQKYEQKVGNEIARLSI